MSTTSTIGPAGARTAPAGGHEPALPVPLDAAVPPAARPADLAVAGALLGVVALLPLPAPVRAVFLAGFVGSAPGSAILSWVSVPIRARAGVIPVLGMSAMTIITLGAMWSYRWHPTGILTTTVVAVLVSSGLCYRKNGWPERIRPTASWRTIRVGPSVLMSIGALAIWGASLPGLPGVDASLYGLLFSGTGPMLAVAILITALGFVVAIRARNLPAAVFALGTAIVVSRVTTTVATDIPLYDWTYKHIAVVDYILSHNLIPPSGTDIYAKWPAFFVTSAWFCDVTGIDPMVLAHLSAPVVHVLIALTVYSAARVVYTGRRVAITAAFVVELVNWVGQDYFSPQAWTLVLAFGLLVLLLASRECRSAGILAIVPFVAIVPSHQLTPFWLLLTTGLLVVTRRARPWWVVPAMGAVAGGYLLLNLQAVLPYGLLSGSSPVQNAASNFGNVVGSPAKSFTSAVCRSLSAAVFLSSAAAAWWLRRRGKTVLALCILAFSPILLLLGQSYGGEAIFRVFLYGLLGFGLLLAPALVSAIDRSRLGVLGASAWLGTVAVAGLHAYVALWPMIVQSREQLTVMNAITAAAEPGVRIMMMHPGGMPTRVAEPYAALTLRDPDFDQPMGFTLDTDKKSFPDQKALNDLEWAVDQRPFDVYILFSKQSDTAVTYYNEYRSDAVADFQEYLSTSPRWKLVYRHGDTVVFRHTGSGVDKWTWLPPRTS